MANFTALFVAHRTKVGNRERKLRSWAERVLWNSSVPMTIYASEEIHLSIPKAADLMGIGRDQVRLVPCDDRLRIDVAKLRETIAADLATGTETILRGWQRRNCQHRRG